MRRRSDQMEPIAVLAGTPVDTQMGVDFLVERGQQPLAFPISRDPREQTAFQLLPQAEKHQAVKTVLEAAQKQGCNRAFVYCNSLSAAVDFPALARETGLRIVTPMHVYRHLAGRYQRLGFVAANAQGLSGIERVLLAENPQLDLLGAAALPVVLAIEAGEKPEEIVRRCHLAALCDWFDRCGMEALLLGCTHFPYIREALLAVTDLPIVDPAEEMLRLLLA